jgi:hypothetical protein
VDDILRINAKKRTQMKKMRSGGDVLMRGRINTEVDPSSQGNLPRSGENINFRIRLRERKT